MNERNERVWGSFYVEAKKGKRGSETFKLKQQSPEESFFFFFSFFFFSFQGPVYYSTLHNR